ncbi:MAG: ATP-binding protein [Liquorilactobacillus sp.]
MNLGKRITAIAGLNGVGKSTILAILTNVGELKKYKTLNGQDFRGDFADVIMYDPDQDTSGEKSTIFFSDLPQVPSKYNVIPELSFRALTQTRKTKNDRFISAEGDENKYTKKTTENIIKRYRLIPIKDEQSKPNERKIEWPTLYLGLSRLIPIGESDSAKKSNIDKKLSDEMIKIHKEVLSENFDPEKSEMMNIKLKSISNLKSGIKNTSYGFASNSNGQDNTGQIIESVMSFQVLKDTLGTDYIGGILGIDELDATLHPAAQNKLFDWLLKMSEKLDLQIVFTTHSLTLLEHISGDLENKSIQPEDVKIQYLSTHSDCPGVVKIKENPPKNYYRYDLTKTYAKLLPQNKSINVLTEDEVARWFLKSILEFTAKKDKFSLINILDINISWPHLINLASSDYEYYQNNIFLLDPDLNSESGKHDLEKVTTKYMSPFVINNAKFNFFTLPGKQKIEVEMWNYIKNSKSMDKLYNDPKMENNGLSRENLFKIGPHSTKYVKDKENMKYKHWFRDNMYYMDIILTYWIRDNKEPVMHFLGLLSSSYDNIISNYSK